MSTPLPAAGAPLKTPVKLTVPNVLNIRKIAISRPVSPTRFTMNAFLAATAADGLYCQNPISR